jgi:hypothetical protein
MGNCVIKRANSDIDVSSDEELFFEDQSYHHRTPNFAAFHARMDQLIRNLRKRQQRRHGYEEI